MRFLDLCRAFYESYNITTEIAVLLFALAILLLVVNSKPENNYMFRHFIIGLSNSIALIVIHVLMLGETIVMRNTHNQTAFNIYYVVYSLCYVVVLCEVFLYINNLSYKRRFQIKQQIFMSTFFSAIWLIIMFVPMIRGQLLEYNDGIYTLSTWSNANVVCSFLDAVACLGAVIINRKDLSKVVLWGTGLFIPVDMLAVLSQLWFANSYFLCATYVLPFVLFFILFHATPYDFVTGCQGMEAETAYLNSLIKKKKQFLHVTYAMPRLEGRNIKDFIGIWTHSINYVARAMENIGYGMRVYNIGPFKYHVICPIINDEQKIVVENKLIELSSMSVPVGDKNYKTQINVLVAYNYPSITSASEYLALLTLKEKNFEDSDMDQLIVVSEEDAIKYGQNEKLVKNLMSIQNQLNLDDDRVEVFIQPIYDLDKKSFRTGESLMRMQIDGKRVFPDQFIPLAEELGCIHSLTKIMLYKVSKFVAENSDKYDFDGLTINVSTMELINPQAAEEFIEIIKSAGADFHKIRLEITESTTISDYKNILDNMKTLNENGVKFYLDDFGTGYSNLERMSGMPFSTIKFDKSLLYRAMEDSKSGDLFHLMTGFFKKTGFSMVVEGVEDEAQRDFVDNAGINYIQGYYYSKPVPAAEAFSFFNEK